MMERIIGTIVQQVLKQEGVTWVDKGLNIFNEHLIIRKENNNMKMYVDTSKIGVEQQKVKHILEKMKKELERKFVIIDEVSEYNFNVITLKLK